MRAIRAIYNFAIERKIAKEEDYPFKVYKVSKLKGKNLKKALTMEEILKIRDLDLKKNHRWLIPETISSLVFILEA